MSDQLASGASTGTRDFLLELRSEEIPARMQKGARAELEKLFRRELDAAGVAVGDIAVWSTPRRLTLIARDLPQATEAVREEAKGPPEGAPDQAVDGFCRKNGVTRDQLEVRDVKGRGTYFAVIEKPGQATADLLADAIPAIIRDFSWPKSQRWGAASISTESLKWVRPLSGIIALFGGEIVPCEISGIASGNVTRGHRFHSDGEIKITGVEDYADKLRSAHVIVDHTEREALVRDGARKAAQDTGLTLVEDEGLVAENAGLTEWPVPLLGWFEDDFLDVPPETIQLTARVNQKYFVCQDASGTLANAFICTANIEAEDPAVVVDGNRKVLAARLADARFFWELDQKKTLEEHAKGLARITFHEKLGTVADKVERVAKLARWLCEEGVVKPSPVRPEPVEGVGEDAARTSTSSARTASDLADMAEQAARLCKADLVTEMVGEFPELQGLMGGYYAEKEGLQQEVSDAIRDHYKPVGQGDDVPTAPVTVAVSLADKLDTLFGFFGDPELHPTGSKDPFALRRAAIGVVRLLNKNAVRLCLEDALESWYVRFASTELGDRSGAQELLDDGRPDLIDGLVRPYFYQKVSDEALSELESGKSFEEPVRVWLGFDNQIDWRTLGLSFSKSRPANGEVAEDYELYDGNYWFSSFNYLVTSLLDFFADRLKVQQREAGVRHDLIDAVFALGGEDDLVRLLARVKALQSFVETDSGTNLLAGYKRAANILKKEEWEPGATNPSPEPAEAALITALDSAEPKAASAIDAEAFEDAMAALASLRAPIDTFFNEVTVNDPDKDKRAARLDLLARFRDAVHRVADFSKIEG
ncbi:glycine--tRNA ligase subunit beta [Qipengyuania sp. DGS5-3]|uniref:glycine--tRNA ligase subunit beta n=1 Tax=Qipengyuania sp. DGS5-3 TaxID=3349632 RepID=UPI0036D3AB9D